MIPLTFLYDEYIDRPKLSEQKKPIWVYSSSPTSGVGTITRCMAKIALNNALNRIGGTVFIRSYQIGPKNKRWVGIISEVFQRKAHARTDNKSFWSMSVEIVLNNAFLDAHLGRTVTQLSWVREELSILLLRTKYHITIELSDQYECRNVRLLQLPLHRVILPEHNHQH